MPEYSGRVFWLGMHKVLKSTELAALRGMGIETFNPAYISPVYDQSADLRIDFDQPTSLPEVVFDRLIAYDFFYRPIEVDIAELLNAYFDTIIVTINAAWLSEVLKVFRGKVIYRVYGQHYLLSDVLVGMNIWRLVAERPDFHIVPFAAETVENEHRWFVDRVSAIVPYQIPDDVFDHADLRAERRLLHIATIFPNIQNPYYAAAYQRFAGRFQETYFRIFGPQRDHPIDKRIVNALPRQDYLDSLGLCSGFYYDYRDSVCYLPPIEAMQLGVPVVCAPGSLLAQFMGQGAPNIATDDCDARDKLVALLRGDQGLMNEMVAAQDSVRCRYDRALVRPAFAKAFQELLAPPCEPVISRPPEIKASSGCVLVPLHVSGLFRHSHGRAYAFEGIPRVVDVVIDTLIAHSDLTCLITCTPDSEPIIYDFFRKKILAGRVELRVIDNYDSAFDFADRLTFVDEIDNRGDIVKILIPHYYLFPEFLLSTKSSVLYLPDYFPHLSPGVVFDVSAEKDALNKRVGIEHAKAADVILTNSRFTRNYLADAGFIEAGQEDKIVVAPLPFLGAGRAEPLAADEQDLLKREIDDRPFLFYPTANRPNKRLDLLMDIYAQLRKSIPDLGLVLTGSLYTHAPVERRASDLGLTEQITFMHHASEGVMRWLYEHCTALCMTSILEGNFPPQVLEALNYRAPVVATRLPTIVEILGDRADELLLCRRLDKDDFVEKVRMAIADREAVLRRQDQIALALRQWNSKHAFATGLTRAFPEMVAKGRVAV